MNDLFGDGRAVLHTGDCLEVMRSLPPDSVDLVFGSPPYEDCRTYGIGFALKGQAWVDWMMAVWRECARVSKGLVAFVIAGRTHNYQWSATPALLMADLHRAGFKLRCPPIYHRSGIPGSGGPDWLRNDYEVVICTALGKLPWSDNTAMGHPPKFKPGGPMAYRRADGSRVLLGRGKGIKGNLKDGSTERQPWIPSVIANPGNVIHCSGGHLGSDLAHETEAPFPEALAEFFIRSFCPPNRIVLDPFCGSGTTLAVAVKHGRRGIGIDIRESQIELTKRRLTAAAAPATYRSDRAGFAPLFDPHGR